MSTVSRNFFINVQNKKCLKLPQTVEAYNALTRCETWIFFPVILHVYINLPVNTVLGSTIHLNNVLSLFKSFLRIKQIPPKKIKGIKIKKKSMMKQLLCHYEGIFNLTSSNFNFFVDFFVGKSASYKSKQ